MKPIKAYGSKPGVAKTRKAPTAAVCFVLDAAHAGHTMRVFMRDQPADRVVRALAPREAARLLGQQAVQRPRRKGRSAGA